MECSHGWSRALATLPRLWGRSRKISDDTRSHSCHRTPLERPGKPGEPGTARDAYVPLQDSKALFQTAVFFSKSTGRLLDYQRTLAACSRTHKDDLGPAAGPSMTLDAEILRHSKWGPRAMRELRQAIRLHAHCRKSVWILIAEGQRKKRGHNTTVRALQSVFFHRRNGSHQVDHTTTHRSVTAILKKDVCLPFLLRPTAWRPPLATARRSEACWYAAERVLVEGDSFGLPWNVSLFVLAPFGFFELVVSDSFYGALLGIQLRWCIGTAW
jgi:hypothetical protein